MVECTRCPAFRALNGGLKGGHGCQIALGSLFFRRQYKRQRQLLQTWPMDWNARCLRLRFFGPLTCRIFPFSRITNSNLWPAI